jgi:hypothetical protein
MAIRNIISAIVRSIKHGSLGGNQRPRKSSKHSPAKNMEKNNEQ